LTLSTGHNPYYTLFYINNVSQYGSIDYEKETVDLEIENIRLQASHTWAASVERALQVVYDGLHATGRAEAWGLDNWPFQRVSSLNPFTRRSQNFTVVFELLNNRNEVIGRSSYKREGFWEFTLRDRKQTSKRAYSNDEWTAVLRPEVFISDSGQNYSPYFSSVDVNKITNNLTIRIASVNGTNAETAARNGVLQIRAITKNEFDEQVKFNFEKGMIKKFGGNYKVPKSIVIPNTIFGDPVTAIDYNVYEYYITSVTIGNNVTLLGGSGLPNSFIAAYNSNNKRAGTYNYNSNNNYNSNSYNNDYYIAGSSWGFTPQ